MKPLPIVLLVTIHFCLIFVHIHQQSAFIGISYELQKEERLFAKQLSMRNALIIELERLQDLDTVSAAMRESFQPLTLSSRKRLCDEYQKLSS